MLNADLSPRCQTLPFLQSCSLQAVISGSIVVAPFSNITVLSSPKWCQLKIDSSNCLHADDVTAMSATVSYTMHFHQITTSPIICVCNTRIYFHSPNYISHILFPTHLHIFSVQSLIWWNGWCQEAMVLLPAIGVSIQMWYRLMPWTALQPFFWTSPNCWYVKEKWDLHKLELVICIHINTSFVI